MTVNDQSLIIDGSYVLNCVSWSHEQNLTTDSNNPQSLAKSAAVSTDSNNQSTAAMTSAPTALTTGSLTWQQMFVIMLSNGCRPRYCCAQFIQRAPSVLHYRLSQTQVLQYHILYQLANPFPVTCSSQYGHISSSGSIVHIISLKCF